MYCEKEYEHGRVTLHRGVQCGEYPPYEHFPNVGSRAFFVGNWRDLGLNTILQYGILLVREAIGVSTFYVREEINATEGL